MVWRNELDLQWLLRDRVLPEVKLKVASWNTSNHEDHSLYMEDKIPHNIQRLIAAVALVIFLVLFVAGAAAAGEAANKKDLLRVRVGIPSISLAQLPLEVGTHVGLFKAEGLDVGNEEVKPTVSIAALINGEMQFTTGGSSALRAAASGAPVKLLTGGSEKPAFYLVSQPGVEKVADLRGKTVAVTSLRSLTDIMVRDILKQHGLDPDKDVKILALGSTANILAGLTSKQIQAGILSPPFDYMGKKTGSKSAAFWRRLCSGPAGRHGLFRPADRQQPGDDQTIHPRLSSQHPVDPISQRFGCPSDHEGVQSRFGYGFACL